MHPLVGLPVWWFKNSSSIACLLYCRLSSLARLHFVTRIWRLQTSIEAVYRNRFISWTAANKTPFSILSSKRLKLLSSHSTISYTNNSINWTHLLAPFVTDHRSSYEYVLLISLINRWKLPPIDFTTLTYLYCRIHWTYHGTWSKWLDLPQAVCSEVGLERKSMF